MRWYVAILGCLGLTACTTTPQQMKAQAAENPESSDLILSYDGAADSIDSMPDCTPELAGSLFWVRTDKTGYDCTVAGEWVARPNSRKPGTEN